MLVTAWFELTETVSSNRKQSVNNRLTDVTSETLIPPLYCNLIDPLNKPQIVLHLLESIHVRSIPEMVNSVKPTDWGSTRNMARMSRLSSQMAFSSKTRIPETTFLSTIVAIRHFFLNLSDLFLYLNVVDKIQKKGFSTWTADLLINLAKIDFQR